MPWTASSVISTGAGMQGISAVEMMTSAFFSSCWSMCCCFFSASGERLGVATAAGAGFA